jgi:hypothetical protein
MIRPCKPVLILASVFLLLAGRSASAQTFQSLFFDDFESYNLGSLEKEDPNGPNQAPNGSGNPWFGPLQYAPNGAVVGPTNGVMPHSGQQMITGQGPSDIDQDWYNLAYRLNNGSPFMENISLDWWFYDPIDPNDPNALATDFRDYVALAYYDTAPADRDGPDGRDPPSLNYNLNRLLNMITRISLGAGPQIGSVGFDPTVYQARVVGADDGLANGWFNTTTPRALGWHHGMIVIGPLLTDLTNDITFYIDDMTTPTLEHNSLWTHGYNVIEINAAFGPAPGYFDDFNFSMVTP